jgi:hypothetical protein
VPTLTKGLISTSAVTQLGHTVTFSWLFITFNLLEIDTETGEQSHLLVKLPNEYYIAPITQGLHRTTTQLTDAIEDQIVSIFVAPIITLTHVIKKPQPASNNAHVL